MITDDDVVTPSRCEGRLREEGDDGVSTDLVAEAIAARLEEMARVVILGGA